MRQVTHKSIIRKTSYGTNTTTLCGRMDNNLEDGWNVAEGEEFTCKHCINASKTYWGQEIIKQAI